MYDFYITYIRQNINKKRWKHRNNLISQVKISEICTFKKLRRALSNIISICHLSKYYIAHSDHLAV